MSAEAALQNDIATTVPSAEQSARETVAQLFAFIIAQGDADYIGENVSQLEHSLQCAYLAEQAGADDETVLGALFHDVGRFIPAAEKVEKMVCADGTYVGRASHEILGEQYLRQLGFCEKICQLVGAHVMAKRYLTAVDQTYYDGLSQASKRTLKFQVSNIPEVNTEDVRARADVSVPAKGGIFNEEQVKEAQKDPWLDAKLAVRRWDDLAKMPDAVTPPLDAYKERAVKTLMQSRTDFARNEKI